MEKLSLEQLYNKPELEIKQETLNHYLNQPPPEAWIKAHPYIKNYRYLPIDKVEWLLRKFFKKYKIEIMRENSAFNGVYVVVRVWYKDPITGLMDFHDGIGAAQLQTASGKSAADLANINSGALSMAFPIAKTIAIKDACDHFGSVFGANINRKDVLPAVFDEKLKTEADKKQEHIFKRLSILIDTSTDIQQLQKLKKDVENFEDNENVLLYLFEQKQKQLKENGKASI